MASRAPADSRIPVFCSNPKPLSRLSRPLANLSNKVRAHLSSDSGSKHRQLFGILGGGPGKSSKSKTFLQPASQSCPSERPTRPTRFFEPFDRPKESFSLTEVSKLEPKLSQVHLGQRVCVAGHKVGVLRYLGQIELDPGTWCGVEFDAPVGLNDGSVRGVRYFACPPLHGVLVPVSKVGLVTEEVREYVSDVSDSGPHSLLAVTHNKRHSMGEDWLKEESTPPPPVKRVGSVKSVSQASTPTPSSTNSNGALIWDWTIGSQHSSSAGSLVPSARALSSSVPDHSHVSLQLSKHSSFEFDDSLGILTPDQMADFTMNCSSEANLPRTPSTEDVPFLIQDLDFDKENASQRRGSKRSSLEMQFEEASVSKSAQSQLFNNITLTKREGSLEEKKYTNEIVMKEPEDAKEANEVKDELMEQEIIKDLSEDTEMSDSNPSKKTSAMSVSYEPGSETVSNSENLDFIRINRTPSLEDLPMDKVDGKLEALAGPSKHALPPPTSFVTSVTSIASLDNGYQGDGEWSRPASRGADHSPLANKVKTMDPMTDSDFFTESDADMHDDTSGQMGSGTGRGDRKAQVIDGTLYGGVSGSAQNPTSGSVYMSNQGNPRCPAFTPNTEEMDSSGIYSDLERKPEEPNSDCRKPLPDCVDDANENEKDFSPEGSTRTGSSMRSDMSQTMISPAAFTNLLMEQVNTIRNLAVSMPMESNDNTDETMEDDVFINVSTTTDITDVLSEKTVLEVKDQATKKREDHGIKKYKMPKRNVVSKIKTMITSGPTTKKEVEDENQENRRPGRTQRKNGRWDAVMNKIAQGKEEEKTKPSRLKEVKSKVFAGITVTPAPAVPPAAQPRGSELQQASRKLTSRNLASSQSVSTRSLRDVSSLKSKSRRSRTRGSECSLPAAKSPASQASSRNSSLSDVSLSKASPQSLRSNKNKRDGVRSTSPQSDGSTAGRPQASTLPPRLLPPRPAVRSLQRIAEGCALPPVFEPGISSLYSLSRHVEKNGGVVAELKSSPVRKASQRRPITAPTKPVPLRDLNRVANVGSVAVGKPEVVSRPPAPAPSVPLDLATKELRHAAQGVEALGVLLNYLVYNLDAFSTPQLKKDLDKMRADWLNTKLQMEEVRVSYLRSEEEKNACQRRLEETQTELQTQADNHTEQVLSLTKTHQERVKELEWRMSVRVEEVEREHSAELERMRQEHSREVERLQTRAAEQLVEREKQLTERIAATQADYDTIKEQSRKLLDSMHSDKDSKLQATAGRCKMLQDEVASLRAVLELRSSELQELRRTSELAQRDALQLPHALQRITALQGRVEDLELQLERKTAVEQTLAAEKANMELKVQQEDNKNKRLSQYNEELMWKLKHSSEVVIALAALSQDNSSQKNSQLSPHSNLTTPKHCHSDSHYRNGMTGGNKDDSPPHSPKVKGVVEKSDSVSWVLDLDESPANVACRLVRRAHSMRAVQSATPSPAHHSRTLPNPHKRQRSRTTTCVNVGPKPQRTRSFSFDSDSSEVPVPRKVAADWDGDFSPGRDSVSPPSQTGSQIDDNEDLIVVETIGEDRLSFLDLERHIDREKMEVMGGEDFASPKLSSSSGGSEASVRSRRNEPKALLRENDTEEILMINRVDGLISSLPKESAGEAMISEETSDNDSGNRDSDEEGERYCSDDDSLSGSASELVERRRKYFIEHKIKIDLKHQNLPTKKVSELMPGSDSGSLSAATTARDLSWSEDIDLLPSESEG